MLNQTDYEKLSGKAINLVAKKRYTEGEIHKKLSGYLKKLPEVGEEDVEKVIARLRELRYLDDELFVQDYISDRTRFKPRGIYLIKRELKQKGLSEELIERAMSECPVDEGDAAHRALEKKMRSWQKDSLEKQRQKAYQFLASKGFKLDTIYKTLESCYDRST